MASTQDPRLGTGTISSLEMLLREVGDIPLLTAEEETELGFRVQAGRTAAEELHRDGLSPEEQCRLEELVADGEFARRRFVESNQRLILSVARRYREHGIDLEDLVQEGNLGLLRAIERFEPERGLRFSTYAIWWIKQAIQRALDDRARLIRLPTNAAAEAAKLWRMADRMAMEEGRDPDLTRAAEEAGLDPGRAVELARATLRPVSLQAIVSEGDAELGELIAGDLEGPDEAIERAAVDDIVREALGDLPDRQRHVLELRFGVADGQPRTLAEVGDELGISRERARQLEANGLRRLRHALRQYRNLLGQS
jgi:RNA polymerase primary sigma factor